jgi:hypothetical protein
MAKNNQKKEKALRNLENARKYRKKSTDKRRRFAGPRPAAPGSGTGAQPAMAFQSAPQPVFNPNPEA